ncbi:MAG: dUTP diphosphatase [Candidatus Magasanikbacteria bacterium CG11_big_fil_rev_8_21_14_0_20_39_34]|uniref:dUTP diphosphatase n=1 Tax=Candidatus Magasanikbacteria bacterium CG11_big_fil_rev_8_21_14_0_20_39_34 TaxID=1974653 RepID=A0A2H0N6A0_9BACT|nr:MAG: dUTP diphosphatase [Candidatus Magasanikbacteria bacterium CG11_big_fil_rev_8_21_14_0_20_39_34]
MQVNIKRIDSSLPLPEYQTEGAVAFDMYSRIEAKIPPGKTALLPTNLIIETPPGYMLMLAARSSLAKKRGLKLANGVGIIDQDYCGDTDEIYIHMHNFSETLVKISPGDRLVQGMFVPIEKATWKEQTRMNKESRGGFGTTGDQT